MLRRRILTLAFLSFVVMGCSKATTDNSSSGTPASTQKIKLALNWVPEPEFGGFYAARDGGAYTKRGLEVEIMNGAPGVPIVQMVAAGRADFGVVSADEVLLARAAGADVVALYSVYQTAPQGIMAHASRGAKTMQDVLKSGTVAMGLGLPYTAYLKKKYGFEGAQVVPYDGGVARFVSDKNFAQQCFVTAEPLAAKKQGVEVTVFLIADEGFNPYTGVVITRHEVIEKNRAMATAFIAATREGWRSYLDDPKPANATMGKLNTAMDADTFAAAAEAQKPLIETAETKARGLGSMTKERWETLANQLVDLKILEKAPDVSAAFVSL